MMSDLLLAIASWAAGWGTASWYYKAKRDRGVRG